MKQYRVKFKHPAYCVAPGVVVEVTGSVLVAARSEWEARHQYTEHIVKCVDVPIVAVECVGVFEELVR